MGCGQSTDGQAWANSTKKVVSDFLFYLSYFCSVFILALRLDVVLLLKLKFFFSKNEDFLL